MNSRELIKSSDLLFNKIAEWLSEQHVEGIKLSQEVFRTKDAVVVLDCDNNKAKIKCFAYNSIIYFHSDKTVEIEVEGSLISRIKAAVFLSEKWFKIKENIESLVKRKRFDLDNELDSLPENTLDTIKYGINNKFNWN